MEEEFLHILNGDGTAKKFRHSGLPGDVIIWKEILSEGPVCQNKSNFWLLRPEYFHQVYGLEKQNYTDYISSTFERLSQHAENYNEVILWFEYDLLCQINLIYLLNWFAENNLADLNFSLISIDSFPGVDHFLGMGQLTPIQLSSLFSMRQKISTEELFLAKEIWQAYSSNDPEDLLKFIKLETTGLKFISAALKAHLERFPFVHNGLNRIENKILEIIQQRPRERGEIFSEFWKSESIYGMGDLQILYYVDLLLKSSIISGENLLKITDEGHKILSGKMKFIDINSYNRWNGGVHLKGIKNIWYWEPHNNNLIMD
ncbi:MAG: hypothetical protein Q8858_12575 [Bacteroidota bacterium]|nr:hypothetical protein [Bacteroidota bacterium]MDP4195999.1 hypothetical protein [Bacteroidota bacterium]